MILGFLSLLVFVILFITGVFAFSYGFTTGAAVLFVAFLFGVYGINRVKSCKNNKSLFGSKTQKKRYAVKGYCISGLPFGECDCDITVYDDCVTFSTGKSASNLSTSKITAAAVKTKNELTSASTGSAILGTALFGVVGTIIASRPKNKSQYILVINYISGELKTIAIAFDNYQKYEAENIAFFLNKKAASSVTEL